MTFTDVLPSEWLIRRLIREPGFSLSTFPGYLTSLPQLLKSCGNEILHLPAETPLPYPTLRWRGSDGTELMVQTEASSESPHWHGELPSGTQVGTSHGAAERALRGAELFAALAQTQLGLAYPKTELETLWGEIHDAPQVIPAAQALQETALVALSSTITTRTDSVVVFNPTDTLRPGEAFLVRLPGDQVRKGRVLFTDREGEPLTSQFLRMVGKEREYLVLLLEVGALGYASVGLDRTDAPADESTVIAEDNILENDFVRVTLNANGKIASLIHKTEDGEREALSATVRLLTDEGLPLTNAAELLRFEVLENGPVRASTLIEWRFHGVPITQRLQLWAHSARVEISTEWGQSEPPLSLKAEIPAAVLASRATYEIPFGAIERPTYSNTDTPPSEVVGATWTDLSEGDFGVSILSPSGVGCTVRENVLSLTLEAPSTYAILPHTGDWRNETVDEAHALTEPLLARFAPKNPKASLPPDYDFVSVDDQGLVINTIKRAEADEDTLVIRLYEALQTRGEATLTLGFSIIAAYETNSLEQNPVPVPFKNNTLTFPYRPFEIKTFLVKRLRVL